MIILGCLEHIFLSKNIILVKLTKNDKNEDNNKVNRLKTKERGGRAKGIKLSIVYQYYIS